MDQKLIDQYMDQLLFAQQGELDAVLMYNKLAEKGKDAKDAATFKQLAAEEGRHASVFHAYTKKTLQPKKAKAPIPVTLSGITTETSLEQFWNARSKISVTPSGIATSPPGPTYFFKAPFSIIKSLALLIKYPPGM